MSILLKKCEKGGKIFIHGKLVKKEEAIIQGKLRHFLCNIF